MTDIQIAELERYFRPIYYVEFEETPEGELFSKIYRIGFYQDNGYNKKEAIAVYNKNLCAKKVIEKSMRTGKEKIIMSR
jgi:hypothetical protein